MDSLSPSVVKLTLETDLFDDQELRDAWSFITSQAGRDGSASWYGTRVERDEQRKSTKRTPTQQKKDWESIRDILMKAGGFPAPLVPSPSPLPTPVSPLGNFTGVHPSESVPIGEVREPNDPKEASTEKKKKKKKSKKGSQNISEPTSQKEKIDSTERGVVQQQAPLSPPDSKASFDSPTSASRSLDGMPNVTSKAYTKSQTKPFPQVVPENPYPSPISGYPSPSTPVPWGKFTRQGKPSDPQALPKGLNMDNVDAIFHGKANGGSGFGKRGRGGRSGRGRGRGHVV